VGQTGEASCVLRERYGKINVCRVCERVCVCVCETRGRHLCEEREKERRNVW
jgi:hypothetical protein